MSKKLVVTIARDASVKVEAEGFNGDGCQQAVGRLLEQMSAQTVGEPELTPDYYKSSAEETELN